MPSPAHLSPHIRNKKIFFCQFDESSPWRGAGVTGLESSVNRILQGPDVQGLVSHDDSAGRPRTQARAPSSA